MEVLMWGGFIVILIAIAAIILSVLEAKAQDKADARAKAEVKKLMDEINKFMEQEYTPLEPKAKTVTQDMEDMDDLFDMILDLVDDDSWSDFD